MILVFGGTTEGKMAAEVADKAGKPFLYSTLEGAQQIQSANAEMISGALDAHAIARLCASRGVRLIVDAAHPFATALHEAVATAAAEAGVGVVRVERSYPPHTPDAIWCDGWDDALCRLGRSGVSRLLVLSGVKTIPRFARYAALHPDIFYRILPRESSRRMALEAGVGEQQLVYYGDEGDADLLRRLRPDAVIMKESGDSGGFESKLSAARELGIKVFVVCRPPLPDWFFTVSGPHGLRRAIERFAPGFFPLRSGFTTGACATAAAKAALTLLLGHGLPSEVDFELPDGEMLSMPVGGGRLTGPRSAMAWTLKDAGDDPDVTDGCRVECEVSLSDSDRSDIRFLRGDGVGVVTLPGIGLPIGSPAVNPVPRAMISREMRRLMPEGGLNVCISVPGGDRLAARTFNPRIGIEGGISIIGTSGIVSPFSATAFIDAMRREMQVAAAVGAERLVLNSGARSERMVRSLFPHLPPQAFIHYGNAIGPAIEAAAQVGFKGVTVCLMIGKAVKLAEGHLDTHSANNTLNRSFLASLAASAGCSPAAVGTFDSLNMASELWDRLSPADARLFCRALAARCAEVCRGVAPSVGVDLLLLSPDGQIFSELTNI